jgi:hypothetical protein
MMAPKRAIGLWVMLALAGTAHAQSAEIFDPAGDIDRRVEEYLDVVESKISLVKHSRFQVQMQVAAPLPALPPGAPGSDGWIIWELAGVDLDPALNPPGYPFPKNSAFDSELMVLLVADGTDYFGLFLDRRPLASGGAPIQIDSRTSSDIQLSIDGDTIVVETAAALWGNPSQFGWRSATLTMNSLGSHSTDVIDFGTDPPFALVPWPG